MNFSEEVKAELWAMIDSMSNDTTPFTMNPGKDFSRKKKWDFASVMKFIISMEGKSLKDEILKYFEYSSEHPTNSSFNQRRAQIKSEVFEYLFRTFLNKYNNDENLYHGYKLIACDGSDISIAHNPEQGRIASITTMSDNYAMQKVAEKLHFAKITDPATPR